jgi:hypothetical protein
MPLIHNIYTIFVLCVGKNIKLDALSTIIMSRKFPFPILFETFPTILLFKLFFFSGIVVVFYVVFENWQEIR